MVQLQLRCVREKCTPGLLFGGQLVQFFDAFVNVFHSTTDGKNLLYFNQSSIDGRSRAMAIRAPVQRKDHSSEK